MRIFSVFASSLVDVCNPGKGKFLLAVWAATSTVLQRCVIDVESGLSTFEDLDFGPPRELSHSEALVMMAAFGIRSTEKAAARLHPDAQKIAYTVLQRVKKNPTQSVLISVPLVLQRLPITYPPRSSRTLAHHILR